MARALAVVLLHLSAADQLIDISQGSRPGSAMTCKQVFFVSPCCSDRHMLYSVYACNSAHVMMMQKVIRRRREHLDITLVKYCCHAIVHYAKLKLIMEAAAAVNYSSFPFYLTDICSVHSRTRQLQRPVKRPRLPVNSHKVNQAATHARTTVNHGIAACSLQHQQAGQQKLHCIEWWARITTAAACSGKRRGTPCLTASGWLS